MALTQVLWSLNEQQKLSTGSLMDERELEETLHQNIELLNQDWLVIGRQVRTNNGKFLDLLCIDRNEDLVVVELKKELTPREVTAQVIEYASYMVEKEPEDLAKIYFEYISRYASGDGTLSQAYKNKFGIELDDEQMNQNVKMVIVASKMDDGTEHIIRYLRQAYQVDINILFFQVFEHGEDRLLCRVWFEEENLDLTEIPAKKNEWNGEYYVSFGSGDYRLWDDAMKFGFISAGGGSWYTKTLMMLHPGDRVWVNIPHTGYVGVGEVTAEMQEAGEAYLEIDGVKFKMKDLDLKGNYFYAEGDEENAEYVVPVKWIKTVPETDAIKETGFFGNQNTVCRPRANKWEFTVDRLKRQWGIV